MRGMQSAQPLAVFIADLHLDGSATPRALAFRGLLAHLSELAHARPVTLHIIGDLFEFWEEVHPEVAAMYEDDLKALEAAHRVGVKIILFAGNRDFLYGEYVEARLGAHYYPDGVRLDMYGKKYWLEHGDLLCTTDVRYLNYRKWVRSWPVRFALECTPWCCAKKLIAKLRSQTVKDKENKPKTAFDIDPKAAFERMKLHDTRALLCGHTHRAQETDVGEGRRLLVLPPWCDEPAGYMLDESGLQRMKFGADGRAWLNYT